MTDPIADFLTRIRNAVKANHKVVEAPGSKIKQEITKILYEQGYILAYKFDTNEKGHPTIKIALKSDAATKTNAIKDLKRIGDAPRTERSGYRHPLDVEGYHDRCQGSQGERRRRDPLLRILTAEERKGINLRGRA